VSFSSVKITSYFQLWRYHVFVQKLTWYFICLILIKIWLQGQAFYERIVYEGQPIWLSLIETQSRSQIFRVDAQKDSIPKPIIYVINEWFPLSRAPCTKLFYQWKDNNGRLHRICGSSVEHIKCLLIDKIVRK